ncbi:pteridine reductase [uncultured Gammaproteobacteria bacterium]
MVQIKRKAALITGAGKRIGREIALDLARNGWAIGVHYFHSKGEADDVVTAVTRAGGRAVTLQCNLGREENVRSLIAEATEKLGPLTCLINNASIFEDDTVKTMTKFSWDMHMETNLHAPVVLSQEFARLLPDEERGCIINMLDQRVLNLNPYFLSYTISKYALWSLTRVLAMALAPRIRVNGIGPGPTLKNVRQTDEHFKAQWESVLLNRGTTPAEICDAVRFILNAPALTGQMIALDGGEHMGWAQPKRGVVPIE